MNNCTVLISTGKCGSNTLIQAITDTFNIQVYKPFDAVDSEHDKQYIVNGYMKANNSKYMSCVFDWILKSQKLIVLLREDHLMRGISIYYANQVHKNKLDEINCEVLEKFYEQPIDISTLKANVLNSYITTETLKSKISELETPPTFSLSYYDLYITKTLQTISELSHFLGVSNPKVKLVINLFKYTRLQMIPNADEIADVFKRDSLDELQLWIPHDLL